MTKRFPPLDTPIQITKWVVGEGGAETTTPRELCSMLTRSIGVEGDWEPAAEVDLCAWGANVHLEFTIGEPAIARSVQVMDQSGQPTSIAGLALADDRGHRVELRPADVH